MEDVKDLTRRVDRLELSHEEFRRQMNDIDASVRLLQSAQDHSKEIMSLRFSTLEESVKTMSKQLSYISRTLWVGIGAITIIVFLLQLLQPFLAQWLGLPQGV